MGLLLSECAINISRFYTISMLKESTEIESGDEQRNTSCRVEILRFKHLFDLHLLASHK